ncbi:uncharacterized protein LOC134228451 [Saccostrea cucullata]|uniref:uncharacterized protein LOC134228451 n=2 Tax=Saccostrea cuccullata TaxID=36930 RepID=UPI002ED2A7F9
MSRHTEFYNGVEYKYILSVLDVFSRYVWLRPLNSKESTEIADALESIYESEGPPKIIQCDNGREFHGSVTRLTEVLGCQIIKSRPYYPQSQGKIESSHKSWKSKLKYDLLKTSDSNWVRDLSKYAMLRNEEYHSSLKASPFYVYHGRESNRVRKSTRLGPTVSNNVSKELKKQSAIRKAALLASKKREKTMIKHHFKKHQVSVYSVGDEVFVKSQTRKNYNKARPRFERGKIIGTKHNAFSYKIRFSSGVSRWINVQNIAAISRSEELLKRQKRHRLRLDPLCECNNEKCSRKSDPNCVHKLNKFCCRESKVPCSLPSHNFPHISDFYLSDNLVNQLKGPSLSRTDTAHDDLVRNALERNLIPVGDIPKDGSCLFHSVAQSLSNYLQIDLNQQDIRDIVVNWLSENPETPAGDRFSHFVPNLDWDTYLEGILGTEWGDHICITAIANAFNIAVGIVSSSQSDLRYILPFDRQNRENLLHIYLGHEFEFHFIRLEPIPGTQADICINEVNFHNVNTVCIPNRDLNSNQNNTDNNNVHSNDFSHYSLQEVQLEPQLTDYSSDSILHLHLSTNDSSLSPPVSHVNIGPSASFPDNELFQTANDHIDSPVPPTLETPTLQRFSPTAISDTNNLSSTEKDRLFPPSLNSSFYLSPPSLSPITDRINDSNLDKQPPVLSPVRLRSNVRPPKKFTPSDYVRARKQIFPETENVNQKQFTDLPYFIQRHILSFVIYKNFNMFLTLIRVSTHFKHLLGTLHKLCPKVYLNENVMFLLEGRSVFAEGVRHNWSVRQLGRVSGSGSGVMMELRNILRPISSRWINGYIEILATAIAGWYYIVDFKFKK